MPDAYVIEHGRESGPFTAKQLRRMAAERRIHPETTLRLSDSDQQFRARQLKGLFPSAAGSTAVTPQQDQVPSAPASPPSPSASETIPAPHPQSTEPDVAASTPAMAETPADTATVASTTGPASEQPARVPAKTIILVGTGLLVSAALGFAGSALTRGDNAAPADSSELGRRTGPTKVVEPTPAGPPERKVQSFEELTEEQQKKVDLLREEADELEKSNRKLKRERDELKDEIDNLVSLLDEVKQWRTVDVILATPSQLAVGMRESDDRVITVDLKSSGQRSAKAVGAAVNARIPVLASSPELTRELHRDVAAGEPVTGDLEVRLRTYYGIHDFLPIDRDAEGEWVTFWDVQRSRRQFGLFRDATQTTLAFVDLSGQTQTIAREDILPGSALKGPYDDVIPAVDERHFLDYCLLRVAQKLQSPAGTSTAHALAVRVQVDDVDRRVSGRIQDPERPGLLRPGESLETEGAVAWVHMGLVAADFMQRLADHNIKLAESRRQRSAARKLEDAVSYLEDEIYTKLNQLGVVTYETEYLEQILHDRDLSIPAGESLAEYGRDALLTHTLIVDVKPPQYRGRYHVSVRLVDLLNGTDVFSENADRVEETLETLARLSGRYRQYHLDSGRLAVVEAEDASPVLESPTLVERPDRKASTRKHLVYLEPDGNGQDTLFRPLFGKHRHPLEGAVSGVPRLVSRPRDVPKEDLFRYIVCRSLQKCMPAAGRIISANGRSARVSIGRASGIQQGDSLRLLRYFDDGYKQVDVERRHSASEHRLPVRLNVTAVNDQYCDVVAGKTGFEDVWYEEFALKPGDIVIPTSTEPVALGFVPPYWGGVALDDKSFVQQMRRSPPRLQQLYFKTGRFSLKLANEVQDAFKNLEIPTRVLAQPFSPEGLNARNTRGMTIQQKQIEALRNAGASHAIGGQIRLVRQNVYHVRLGVLPLVPGGGQSYELTDAVDFTINDYQLPE